jgi:branched-subunit amino acid aminotransferase/4-amino-4-deoxychorismate lyase
MDRNTTYTALLEAAFRRDEEHTRRWLRTAQAFGLPETRREHFILGYALGRIG